METKKNKNKDVRNRRGLFFQIGMICSIGISLVAFNWQTSLSEDILPLSTFEEEPVIIIPSTDQPEEKLAETEDFQAPEPPERQSHLVNPVSDSTFIINRNPDTALYIKPTGFIKPDTIKEEQPRLVDFASKMPVFPGGEDAMRKFIYSNFNFPPEAQTVGAHGKVFIEFIVDEHGKMTNIKIAKDGVGFGCGEEALRVVELVGKKFTWTPGEQINAKVRVRYRYPIVIKLNK